MKKAGRRQKLEKRRYQTRSVRDLLRLFRRFRRIVGIAPTGSGKTVIGALLLCAMRGKRVLWLAHRVELLRQAYDQLLRAGIPEADLGILTGPEKTNPTARVLIASVQMFAERDVPEADLIVVDEAHRVLAKSYRDIVKKLPRAKLLGLTATPWRLDGRGLGEVFQRLYVIAEAFELVKDGYIAAPWVYGISEDKARELVRGVPIQDGDYVAGRLERALMKGRLLGNVVKEKQRLARGESAIAFCVSRVFAKKLTQRLLRAKIAAEYLDGETNDTNRQEILSRLRRGVTEVVVNVDVLVEGFDCPPVKCIMMCRPTRSLTRYLQQIGRANRPSRRKRPRILDHAGNCWRFGLPTTPREWTLDGRPRGAQTSAPVRFCPACESMVPLGCRKCPECGKKLPATEQERLDLREREAELERIKATAAAQLQTKLRVRAFAKERGLSLKWQSQVLTIMKLKT